MADCYRKGYERGLWYEIKCLEDTIRAKEAAGKDTTFENELLTSFRAYAKARGYKSKALDQEYHFNAAGLKDGSVGESSTSSEKGLPGIMLHPGRPPKADSETVSRMTTWRRKQRQLV